MDFIFKIKENKSQNKKGFSLVETLVAITILLAAIGAPLTIAQRAFSDARVAKNQATAIFLAQEAMEYMRNVRDYNNIQSLPWTTNLSCSLLTCAPDPTDSVYPSVNLCGIPTPFFPYGNCPNLRYDSSSGLYGYDPGWQETVFKRAVQTETVSATEILVRVHIEWDNGRSTSSYDVVEYLTNWHGI